MTVLWHRGAYWSPFRINFESNAAKILLIKVLEPIIATFAMPVRVKTFQVQVVSQMIHFWNSTNTIIPTNPFPESSPAPEFLSSFYCNTGAYNLYETAKSYIGLFPLAAIVGDEIAIIDGCDTPFLISSGTTQGVEGTCGRVGECYVHGIMEGELFEDARFRNEYITLR
jgi:hypothetical protein